MVPLRFAMAIAVAGTVLTTGVSADQAAPAKAAATTIVLETVKGTVEIETFPTDAPKSLAHVLSLVKSGFYRGLRVHWVQPGVVQFGDPASRDMSKMDGWGTGGSGKPVGAAETSKRKFDRGIVGLAYQTGRNPTSADSQLFILRAPNPALDGKYAIIGRVTKGMDVVDKLAMADQIKLASVK